MRTNEIFLKNKLVSMTLFLSSNIHQDDERFSVHSRGKQCAFMTFSVILTTQNMPLTKWSKQTFTNVFIREDKMYLKANQGVQGITSEQVQLRDL